MKNVSITKLHTHTSRILSDLKKEKTTVLTGTDGQPRAYLVDSGAYEQLHARVVLLEGIARGERAIQEGRVLTHTQAKKKMGRWLKRTR